MLLNTRYLRFKNRPKKLQRRFMGPFQIKSKISGVAYELDLPASWSVHPVFHSSLLKPWRESKWRCPINTLVAELEISQALVYQVEGILKWRKAQGGHRGEKEVPVIWTGYPLEEAQWIPQENFTNQDCPIKETNKPQPSTSASLALRA